MFMSRRAFRSRRTRVSEATRNWRSSADRSNPRAPRRGRASSSGFPSARSKSFDRPFSTHSPAEALRRPRTRSNSRLSSSHSRSRGQERSRASCAIDTTARPSSPRSATKSRDATNASTNTRLVGVANASSAAYLRLKVSSSPTPMRTSAPKASGSAFCSAGESEANTSSARLMSAPSTPPILA